jgi:hypothetical protein
MVECNQVAKFILKCDAAHMTTDEALQYFKTRKAIAEAALVSHQAVTKWFKLGLIPARSGELLRRAMKPKRRA